MRSRRGPFVVVLLWLLLTFALVYMDLALTCRDCDLDRNPVPNKVLESWNYTGAK